MLRPIALLLNLFVIGFITKQPLSIHTFAMAIAYAVKIRLDAVAQQPSSSTAAPSKLLRALLQPTRVARGETCVICRDTYERAHKISCNHVFCLDCALLTFAKRDTCPLCNKLPVQFFELDRTVDAENITTRCLCYALISLLVSVFLLPGLVVQCLWHWQLPNVLDVMLVAMRACFVTSLDRLIHDLICSQFPNKMLGSSEDDEILLTGSLALVATAVATSTSLCEALIYSVVFGLFALVCVLDEPVRHAR